MNATHKSPWIAQFDGLVSREAIRLRAEFAPDSIPDLLTQPAHLASASLSTTLKKIIVLSEPDLDLLTRLVQRSHAYAVEAYPSVSRYMTTLHSREIQISSPAPVCLTGLAGTGKSTLLTALERALPDPTELQIGAALVDRVLSFRSHARTNVKSSRDFVEILAPWLPQESQDKGENLQAVHREQLPKKKSKMSLGSATESATRHSYRVGLYASLVDEMQFFTQDATANATPTKFLLMMSYLGVPLVYSANYSLCNKLLKRNQEDRDRLLSDIVVVRPLELTEQGLGPVLRIYDRVLKDCVKGSLCEFIPQYAAMTLGIKRKIRELTVAAFEEMRRRNESKLTLQHLKSAYERGLSQPFRNDVQCLHQLNSVNKPVAGQSDLWCPFGIEYNRFTLLPSMGDGGLEQNVTGTLLRQSLTADEKNLVAGFERPHHLESASPVESEMQARPPKVQKRKREHTAAELLSNTISHQNRT